MRPRRRDHRDVIQTDPSYYTDRRPKRLRFFLAPLPGFEVREYRESHRILVKPGYVRKISIGHQTCKCTIHHLSPTETVNLKIKRRCAIHRVSPGWQQAHRCNRVEGVARLRVQLKQAQSRASPIGASPIEASPFACESNRCEPDRMLVQSMYEPSPGKATSL